MSTTPEESVATFRKMLHKIKPCKNTGPSVAFVGPQLWEDMQKYNLRNMVTILHFTDGWRRIESRDGRSNAEIEAHIAQLKLEAEGDEE